MIACTGWMIPGLCFQSGHCLWILRWDDNPLGVKPLVEVWLIDPDGKRSCWVSDPRGVAFFRTYHDFHTVTAAEIQLQDDGRTIALSVKEAGELALEAEVETGSSLLVSLVNLVLKLARNAGQRGKTETGKAYFNHPRRIRSLKGARVKLRGTGLGALTPPRTEVRVGDGVVPRRPMLNECTHWLED